MPCVSVTARRTSRSRRAVAVLIAFIVASAVAVFSRSRRAGAGEGRDRGGDAMHRLVLVAGRAATANSSRTPTASGKRARRTVVAQDDKRDVVLLLELLPVKRSRARSKPSITVCESVDPRAGRRHGRCRTSHAADRAPRPGPRRRTARRRGRQRRLALLVDHARHQPEGHAGRPQLRAFTGRVHEREVVPGVGVAQAAAGGVEHAVETGDEHVLRDVGAEVVVDVREDRAGLEQSLRAGLQHASGGCITIAAGTPLSVTSPMTRPSRPSAS